MSKFCLFCFSPLTAGGVCPRCGFDSAAYQPKPYHLPPQTILHGRYCVGKALGEGGFGVTYAGYDMMLKRRVAIKEYYPSGVVWRDPSKSMDVVCLTQENVAEVFKIGRQKSLQEAQSLASLDDIPAIVRILDFFAANNTAYIIMEFVEGVTLRDYIKKLPKEPTLSQLIRLLSPVTMALETIHKRGFVHRDISPDNIMITRDGSAKLLDFGAVKHVTAGGSATETPIVKRGFSPLELYSTTDLIGSWTDVYSLAATMYFLLVGEPLDEPANRLNRDTAPEKLSGVLTPAKTDAMLHALALRREDRQQSIVGLIHDLTAPETAANAKTQVLASNDEIPRGQNKTAPAPKKKKSKLPILFVLLVAVIVIIVGVFLLKGSGDKSGGDASSDKTEKTKRSQSIEENKEEETEPPIIYKTAEEEPNNSFSTANDIEANSSVTGELFDESDEDYYRFELASDGHVSFSFNHDRLESGSAFWKLTLYSADQTPYMSREFTGDQTLAQTADIGLPAGVYYVGINKAYYYSELGYTFTVKYSSASNWETEPNDTFAASDPVAVNSEFVASLTDEDDNDYFKFSTPEDGYVNITFKHDRIDNDSSFWQLTLYDASQTLCMAREFYGSQTTATTANIGLPAGDYYVRVNKTRFSDIDYNVTVNFSAASGWETEQNGSFSQADPIDVNAQITASLTDENDNDYFVFTTASDGCVSFTFNHDRRDDSATFWELTLYDDGQTPYMSRSFSGNQPTVETAKIGLPAGTYYVRVNKYRYLDIAYNLTVNFTEDANWETEPNSEFALADPIAAGTKVSASLISDQDNDYYKVTLNSGGNYRFTLTHDSFDDSSTYWRVFLYSAEQEELKVFDFHGNQASEATDSFALNKGTYYVRVQPYRYTDRTYQLLLST